MTPMIPTFAADPGMCGAILVIKSHIRLGMVFLKNSSKKKNQLKKKTPWLQP
jgi:hypothetical protein